MTKMKTFNTFFFVLLISYMPIIGAYYIKQSNSQNIGSPFFLNKHKIDSPENEITYSVPVPKNVNYSSLSLGVVSPPPTIFCDEHSLDKTSASASQFEKNTNTIIHLPLNLTCSNIKINFKKQTGYPNFGQISGMAMFSDAKSAISYKRIIDFFTRDIRIFLLIIVLLYIYFYSYEKIINSKSINQDFIERHSISWGLFLISSSGIIETVLPQINPALLSQLNSYLSAVAHLAPGIDLILFNFFGKNKKQPPLYIYYLGFSYILISPERIYAMAIVGIPIGIVSLISSLNKKSEIKFSIYAALILVNFLKLIGWYNPEYLPHIHLVSIYVGALMFQSTLLRIQLFGKITSAAFWQNNSITDGLIKDEQVVTQILNKLLDLGDFGRVSYISVLEGSSSIQILSFKREVSNKIVYEKSTLNGLPPVYAAVIASGEPIWHEHSSSERSKRLRKNSPDYQLGGHYSIIPLKHNAQIIGAIGITGYTLTLDSKMEEFYKKIILSFSNHLEKSLGDLTSRTKLISHQGLNEAKNELTHFLGFSNRPDSLFLSLSALSKSMSSGFILFSKDKQNKYTAFLTVGFDHEIDPIAGSLTVEKNDLNEHGPFPLSLRSKKSVFINQVFLLNEVLSKRTVDFLKNSNTKSLAVLPILQSSDTKKDDDIKFVIMMVNKAECFFSSEIQILLKAFISAIEQKDRLLNATNLVESHTNTLASFVPQEVVSALMNKSSTRLESTGFLGCLDIIGSTRFLNKHGDQIFLKQMHTFTEYVKTAAETSGMQIFTTNWDAIYIHSENFGALAGIYHDLYKSAKSVFNFDDTDDISIRLCVTYGNTSRDFSEAEGFRRWTIVGNAMSEVCKFEQKIKSFGEGIYVNSLAYENIPVNSSIIKFLKPSLRKNNEEIYVLNAHEFLVKKAS
jgi:hypothetical protein